MAETLGAQDTAALGLGRHPDPFAVLGIHQTRGGAVVRTFQPQARRVDLVVDGESLLMHQIEPNGLFELHLHSVPARYQLRTHDYDGNVSLEEDAYRFASADSGP